MGFDVTYTAKWSKLAITQNIFEAGVVTSNDKYILGQELKITATTYLGYDFVGWYCNDTLIADSCEYTFRTSANNETYTAKWKIKDELKNFKFSSKLKFCEIEGVYDKTITEVVIPDYVTSIGKYAFSDCSGFASITIPDSVTSIGIGAFENCSGLTSIVIPDSVTSIGDSAFSNCTSLISISIGIGVTSIDSYAFEGCSGLTKVNICSIENWCSINFNNSYSNPLSYAHNLYLNGVLVTDLIVPDTITSIKSYAFLTCSGLTNITIPDSVTSIKSCAFFTCSGLTSITIPDSVTSIDGYAFGGCSGLENINVALNNTKYYSLNNCIIEKETNTLILGCKNSIIPDSVTSIGSGAFSNCSGLTSITIPNSVTYIGDYAFEGCSKLKEIHYNGTIEEWNKIQKESWWNDGTGDYTVYCTDSNITK